MQKPVRLTSDVNDYSSDLVVECTAVLGVKLMGLNSGPQWTSIITIVHPGHLYEVQLYFVALSQS